MSHREKAKTTDGTVTKFDHRVSAKGSAAKTVESETKIEKLPEMHPPAHGTALKSQSQSLQNDDTFKEKKTKKERKEDDVDKHTKEEVDDGENYQILDSLDEQMGDGDQEGNFETCLPEPEDVHSLHEESFQVLDSVDNEPKVCPEESSELEMDTSFQVVDSITEEQAATRQNDSPLVKDETSTVSEEDVIQVVCKSNDESPTKDTSAKYQEAKEVSFQMLDTGSKQAPEGKEDVNRGKLTEEEVKSKMLSAQSSKDVEKPDDHIQNEDQPLEDRDNKDLHSDVNEQETFEILDSIDDQTEMEDESQKLETPSDQMSKEDTRPVTTETDSETDNKEKRTKKSEATTRKDNRPSKRSSSTRTRTSKSEEREKSPKKQDRTVKKYETRTKMDTTASASKTGRELTEEMEFEIVDSVEDEPVQNADTTERSSRRRSARGKREDKTTLNTTEVSEKAAGGEDATYKILDSVDDEAGNDEPTITTRSTRGRKEKTVNKDLLSEKTKKEDTPTRRRHTPARDSQEKTPKKEEKASPKESSPTKKCDIIKEVSEENATYEILDSVANDQPATEGKGRRGRPKKDVETTKKDSVRLKKGNKDAPDKVADEEEVTYQILDSVEDEVADDQSPTEQSKKISESDDQQTKKSTSLPRPPKNEEEEEEPVYEIVDSLEEDQVQEEPVTAVVETSKQGAESLHQKVDNLADTDDDHSLSDTATTGENKRQKSDNKCDTLATTSTLVNLDEVSEEEEDYPDDTDEKEELRRRQAATKEKQLTKEREKGQEERKTRGREERERRSQSSSSRRGGGIDGGAMRRGKEKGGEKEEKLKVDTKELLTLDEVGADEGGEERLQEGQEWVADISEGELQALVTLDEIVDEEEEGKVDQNTLEARLSCKEDKSVDSLNPEVRLRLKETQISVSLTMEVIEKPHKTQI